MRILLLATEHGVWRREYAPDAPMREEDFHVDAPAVSLRSICGRGAAALVLAEEGRLLSWDPAARLFREETSPAGDAEEGGDGEFEAEFCYLAPSGRRYLAGCPPRVLRSSVAGEWTMLEDPAGTAGSGAWQGLEAPYEPRVSALLETRDGELYAAVSVGGLLVHRGEGWEEVAASQLPRDLRALAFAHGQLWIGGGQGLWRMHPDSLELRRASLPPAAAFVARILALPAGLLVTAAPGPPATWRGPDGSRTSLWYFPDGISAGRSLGGPLHGVVTGLEFDGEAALLTTDDGELWRVPLEGPAPQIPILGELPATYGVFLVDAVAPGG